MKFPLAEPTGLSLPSQKHTIIHYPEPVYTYTTYF